MLLVFICPAAVAIDNPDVPDYVADFLSRSQSYESRINEVAVSTAEIVHVYSEYETFLDTELNHAYVGVLKKLGKRQANGLVSSQRQWLKYRDTEFRLIDENWIPENFGTSSRVSRGSYRTRLVKDRVIQLLYYLKN